MGWCRQCCALITKNRRIKVDHRRFDEPLPQVCVPVAPQRRARMGWTLQAGRQAKRFCMALRLPGGVYEVAALAVSSANLPAQIRCACFLSDRFDSYCFELP